jgi:hypothetical protein
MEELPLVVHDDYFTEIHPSGAHLLLGPEVIAYTAAL